MSILVNIKHYILIAINLVFVFIAVNFIYPCLLSLDLGGNCGISFTFTVIPLFIFSLLTCIVYYLISRKHSRALRLTYIVLIFIMWCLAYMYGYLKINNYL
jgi:hypothetical protein